MNLPRFTVLIRSLAGISLLALSVPAAFAQAASIANVLGQLSTSFSSGNVVQSVSSQSMLHACRKPERQWSRSVGHYRRISNCSHHRIGAEPMSGAHGNNRVCATSKAVQ